MKSQNNSGKVLSYLQRPWTTTGWSEKQYVCQILRFSFLFYRKLHTEFLKCFHGIILRSEGSNYNKKIRITALSVRIWGYSGPHFSRIFPHSDWIRRDTNVGKCGKNTDQNDSEYRHFLPIGCYTVCLEALYENPKKT